MSLTGSGLPVIAVSSGEPAGIGPELCLSLVEGVFAAHPVVLADRELLASRASLLGRSVRFRDWQPGMQAEAGTLDLIHVPLSVPAAPGQLDARNGRHVLALLDLALAGCRDGRFAAMVTAPVHKGVINAAGIPFTGHTEYLAEQTGTPQVVMMLAGETALGPLRVALVTTHLPLRAVPDAIVPEVLAATIRIVSADLRAKYGIERPRILVTGLNPHAGEGGYLGREEIDIIAPVLAQLRGEGHLLEGPLPADTVFTPPVLARGDCVLAMYHDQGLAALKYATFGHGINVTLGLPLIRTSVDHGTALELAGRGCADPGSLHEALRQAAAMAQRQQDHGVGA